MTYDIYDFDYENASQTDLESDKLAGLVPLLRKKHSDVELPDTEDSSFSDKFSKTVGFHNAQMMVDADGNAGCYWVSYWKEPTHFVCPAGTNLNTLAD